MIKKILSITILILLSSISFEFCFSQNIKGVGILGLNLSQIEGDRLYGYKKQGINIGLGTIIPFYKNFSANLETLFSQLGSYEKASFQEDTIEILYKAHLNYVEIPVFLNFYDKKGKMNFGAGTIFSRLTDGYEIIYDRKITYQSGHYPWNRWDYRWFVNFYIGIYKNIKVNVRYSYSLTPIRYKTFSDGETWEQFNQVLSFRLMWIWNEKDVKN